METSNPRISATDRDESKTDSNGTISFIFRKSFDYKIFNFFSRFFFYVRKFARRMVMDGYILSYTFCACFLPGEDSAIKNNNGAARFKGIETKPGKGRGQNEKAARREAV